MKARSIFDGQPLSFAGKPYTKSLIVGPLIFGLGWGFASARPGTALVMLGEGKLGVRFTLAGIVLGAYLFGMRESRGHRATGLPDSWIYGILEPINPTIHKSSDPTLR